MIISNYYHHHCLVIHHSFDSPSSKPQFIRPPIRPCSGRPDASSGTRARATLAGMAETRTRRTKTTTTMGTTNWKGDSIRYLRKCFNLNLLSRWSCACWWVVMKRSWVGLLVMMQLGASEVIQVWVEAKVSRAPWHRLSWISASLFMSERSFSRPDGLVFIATGHFAHWTELGIGSRFCEWIKVFSPLWQPQHFLLWGRNEKSSFREHRTMSVSCKDKLFE